ncbi:hypothetical protein BGX29_006865 [Mortierella sp. GBA35]|nr:hypothetical protein BGX23_005353 [Mortierella sp. AD031]KAF9099980.1 hypothetical protein BGX29_006865 [Mortierella sp. GBA35]KAG0213023.1 hypothetical protein BGX33_003210 [Mortierella sp. NVP41]
MSSLSNTNSATPATSAPAPAPGAVAAAAVVPPAAEPIFDARNVDASRFRVGGFQGISSLPPNFLASGDVDAPAANSEAGQMRQEGDEAVDAEEAAQLAADEAVRKERQAKWAAMVASGEVSNTVLGGRPGRKITLPVEKPKFY